MHQLRLHLHLLSTQLKKLQMLKLCYTKVLIYSTVDCLKRRMLTIGFYNELSHSYTMSYEQISTTPLDSSELL